MHGSQREAPEERVLRSVGTRLALTTALLVLLFSAGSYVALRRYEWHSLLEAKREAARAVVTLFAEALSAPVVFGDEEGIKESLAFLKSNPEVHQAAVFALAEGGQLGPKLGEYAPHSGSPGQLVPPPLGASRELLEVHGEVLDATRWVRDRAGRRIALAAVRFALTRERARFELLARSARQVAAALAVSLTLLLLLLARVHIIQPLRALHAAVRKLEAGGSGDPGPLVKLAGKARDEVGDLARDFVVMAEAIAGREAAIARKNHDMRVVLESVGQGFLLLSPDGRVHGHHSDVLESWFGPVRQGQLFWEYLRAHDPQQAEWLELTWANIGAPYMPLELCLEQIPRRFSARERSYDVEYRPRLRADGALECMVVVISDVTELLVRERAEKQQRELVGTVGRLLSDRGGFLGFYESTRALVAQLAGEAVRERAAILRDLHTLKGNAGLYGLAALAARCEAIEARCAQEGDVPTQEERAALAQTFAPTVELVERFVAERGGDALLLSAADYRGLELAIRAGEAREGLLSLLARARAEPAAQALGRLGAQLEVLARGLGKDPVHVQVEAAPADLRLPRASFAPLWAVAVHVLRNIADHGLESSWERERAHKPPGGSVVLRAALADGLLTLSFADDGRGVDLARTRERAQELGVRAESEAELLASLFTDGVSTRPVPGDVSGRGVGLSAVKAAVEALAGRVWLESEAGRGARLFIELPARLLT